MGKYFWEGEKVRLRAAGEDDLTLLSSLAITPDSLRQYYEDEMLFPSSAGEAREGIAADLKDFYKDDKRLFMLETINGEYAGQLQVWQVNRRAGTFRHGIFMEESFRGRGLAREALVITLDFYFNELNYRKCNPYIYPFNERSIRFHESAGFTLEARVKEEHYSRGRYHDILYYGLFKDAFNALHGQRLWAAPQ